MSQTSADASRTLARHANAMTDVTGFGLAGHLSNICRASGVGARIDLSAVPIRSGAEALAGQGIRSSLWAQNRASVSVFAPDTPRADLVFDPQTAGGLLAAVPQSAVADILLALPGAVQIGAVTASDALVFT